MPQHWTRLAPSPTGALHLGNVRTFLINWAMARQQGWKIVLRIEDLDSPRVKREAARVLLDTLAWLGLDWDVGPIFQSHDLSPYHDALARLVRMGAIYPCRCTRSDIMAASLSAPHLGDHELRYPGTCRPPESSRLKREDFDAQEFGWRLRVPPGSYTFRDHFVGDAAIDTSETVGDFLVATKGGIPSYQLAVVVDDARQGIDRIVRGADLLSSVPRQALLYRLLGLGEVPNYWHLPLVIGDDGRRLAKRHGDTRIETYRAARASAKRVIGLIAHWSGYEELKELTALEFAEQFRVDRVPPHPVVFTEADDEWLRKG